MRRSVARHPEARSRIAVGPGPDPAQNGDRHQTGDAGDGSVYARGCPLLAIGRALHLSRGQGCHVKAEAGPGQRGQRHHERPEFPKWRGKRQPGSPPQVMNMPPRTGPGAVVSVEAAAQRPSARPRSATG